MCTRLPCGSHWRSCFHLCDKTHLTTVNVRSHELVLVQAEAEASCSWRKQYRWLGPSGGLTMSVLCRLDDKIKKLDEQLIKHREAIQKLRPGPAQDNAKRRALNVRSQAHLSVPHHVTFQRIIVASSENSTLGADEIQGAILSDTWPATS